MRVDTIGESFQNYTKNQYGLNATINKNTKDNTTSFESIFMQKFKKSEGEKK